LSRKLSIIRHAKSSWDDPVIADFDRPLNPRGMRDAPLMAARLAANGILPDRIISSPAKRAICTARTFAKELALEPAVIEPDERLYLASADTLLDIIRDQDRSVGSLMLFGHNPGLTELVHRLGDCPLSNLPTCACAIFRIDGEDWAGTSRRTAHLEIVDYPKKRTSPKRR